MSRRLASLIVLSLLTSLVASLQPAMGQEAEVEGELSITVTPPSPGFIGEEITVFAHDPRVCDGRETNVIFRISGANNFEEIVPLDDNGDASFSYIGIEVGTDVITAEVEYFFIEGTCTKELNSFYPSTTTFTWLDHTVVQGELELSISPGSPEPIGNQITVVAHDSDPCVDGQQRIRFEVSGANEVTEEVTVVEGAEEIPFTYTGINTGVDRISAQILWEIGPCGNITRSDPTIAQFEWIEAVCSTDQTLSLSVSPATQSLVVGQEAAFVVDTLCDGVAQPTEVTVSVTGANNLSDAGVTPWDWSYSSASLGQDSVTFRVDGYDVEESVSVDWALPSGSLAEYTADEKYSVIAAQHPEFSGFLVNEDSGTMLIAVVDEPERIEDLHQTITDVWGLPSLGDLAPSFSLVPFAFNRLGPWHEQITRTIFEEDEVVHTFVEDATGTIIIGVASPIPAVVLASHLEDMDVPPQAIKLTPAAPAAPHSSLTDHHRPVVNGLGIGSSSVGCTLGFGAHRNGVDGFVTNSHCTSNFAGTDGTVFGQPSASTGFFIGDETYDREPFTKGKCPKNKKCRWSDAAFVTYRGGVSFAHGLIARADLGQPSWNGNSYFVINGKASPANNANITKVGATTGRTQGRVQDECVNTGIQGFPTLLLCQGMGSYTTAKGDSGSPVFAGGTDNTRYLYGINWGGSGSTGYFSPWANMRKNAELGDMQVCPTTGYAC